MATGFHQHRANCFGDGKFRVIVATIMNNLELQHIEHLWIYGRQSSVCSTFQKYFHVAFLRQQGCTQPFQYQLSNDEMKDLIETMKSCEDFIGGTLKEAEAQAESTGYGSTL